MYSLPVWKYWKSVVCRHRRDKSVETFGAYSQHWLGAALRVVFDRAADVGLTTARILPPLAEATP